MNELLAAAIDYAAAGIPVFPCGHDKAPLTKRGLYAATTEATELRRMFTPAAALIGCPTGKASGVVAVDIDMKPGRDGAAWIAANKDALPATRVHRTRSGGFHYLFRAADKIANSAGKLGPGVDVRGDGGYIVVPPSPGYEIIDANPPASIPGWLAAACRAPRHAAAAARYVASMSAGLTPAGERAFRRLIRAVETVQRAPEGQRNDTLNREAFLLAALAGAGLLPVGEITAALDNAGRTAGLSSAEIAATLRSALGAGKNLPL